MELQGSCRCGAVKFSALSHTPYPFMRCYCTICRKAREARAAAWAVGLPEPAERAGGFTALTVLHVSLKAAAHCQFQPIPARTLNAGAGGWLRRLRHQHRGAG